MVGCKSVLITGASSGIGRALAEALAGEGVVLHLAGRNRSRLQGVAAACRARGAKAIMELVDVRDAAAMAAWIGGAGPLDLVVANAGVSGGTADGGEAPAQLREIFAVDLDGALNTILPAMALMAGQAPDAQGVRGRIAAVASLAAFGAAPGAPAYCAAKAALDAWVVASAPMAAQQGIVLSSVCPGYVRSAMTAANRFPMPGLMTADRAAAIILRGLARGRRRIAFPWWMYLAARTAGLLPPSFLARQMLRLPGKAPLTD